MVKFVENLFWKVEFGVADAPPPPRHTHTHTHSSPYYLPVIFQCICNTEDLIVRLIMITNTAEIIPS